MHNTLLSLVRRGGSPLLLGVLTFWSSIRGAGAATTLAVAAVAALGAFAFNGNAVSRLAWAATPLWAMAAASWSGAVLGAAFGALLAVSLRCLSRREFLHFGWSGAAFFVFANAFVFSSQMIARQNAALIFSAASLALILGAHVTSLHASEAHRSGAWQTVAILLVLIMELVFALRLLPYGYLSLAAIAAVWYFTLLALYEAYLMAALTKKKIGQELSFAAALTLAIALSSGIQPR